MIHYLITLPLAHHMHMHAFVMFEKEKNTEKYTKAIANQMLDAIEKGQAPPLLMGMGLFLQTKLVDKDGKTSGVDVVLDVFKNHYPAAMEAYATATDFHMSMWMMPDEEPDDKRLMELH